ncbi:MAG: ATP-binding protein [Acidobacteriota bacterium]
MRPLFILLLVFLPHLLWAQPQIGELEVRLEGATGQDRIEILLKLATTLGEQDASRALAFANEATQLARQGGTETSLIRSLEQVGSAQMALGEDDAALASYRESLRLARQTQNKLGIAQGLLAIGKIHLDGGRPPAAAITLERALAAENELEPPRTTALTQIHSRLADAYARAGRHREAYEALQRYGELADTATSEKDAVVLAALEAELEAARKQHEADTVRHQQELATLSQELEAKAAQSASPKGIAAVAAIGLVAFLLSLLSRQRLKTRLTETLANREFELDEATGQLDEATANFQRTHDELDQTTNRLQRTAFELERTASELGQTKGALEEKSTELDRTTFELNRTASDLEQANTRYDRTAAELRQVAELRDRTSVQLAESSKDLEQTADELAQALRRLSATSSELAQLKRSYREDISELGDRNATTRERLSEMERFTSTVSQHLKVLLISIRSSLGALQQDAAAGDLEQLKEDVGRTHDTVGRVVRLLDKLLKLLLVGRVVNAPAEVPMSELAFEAVGQVAGLVSNRLAEIVIAPDMPSVVGDRAQLLEALRNLLENSGKFMGTQAAPKIEVASRKDGQETVFFVRDNGLGIDPRDHERIFTLFERIDDDQDGVGLGLGLVKRIIEAHGGRVWVESEGRGHGSTFCFTLPEMGGEIESFSS